MEWTGVTGRFGPFREFEREVGRLLENLGSRPFRFHRPFPPINLYDADDRYLLTAELPGLGSGDVDLSITGETLTMRGERSRPLGVPDELYRRQERLFGSWSRSVTLPSRVDSDRVTAHFQNGVLTVVLPKMETGTPRQIPVTSGGLET